MMYHMMLIEQPNHELFLFLSFLNRLFLEPELIKITARIFQAMRVSHGDNVNKFSFCLTLIGQVLLFSKSCKLD